MPVMNPFTGLLDSARHAAPDDRLRAQVLAELPTPNVPGVAGNNYLKSVPNESNYDKFNVRLDHTFGNNLSGFVRLGQQKNNAFEAPNIDGPSGSNQNGNINVAGAAAGGGRDLRPRPTMVLDARLGVSRMGRARRPPVIGGPSMFDLYGITGLPENDPVADGRGLTPAEHHRLQPARTAGDESAIPEPVQRELRA